MFFRLRDGASVALYERGVRHPAGVRFAGEVFTPYEDITHVAASARMVRIGTRRSVYVLQRAAFVAPAEADHFVGLLAQRVARGPTGPAQIARMREIERTAATAGTPRVVWALAGLCLVGQLLQATLGPVVEEAGHFSASLVRSGEVWRLVTANLLHAAPWFPVHFLLNTLGLVALGALLEWSIGSARTALVLAASGIGAMGAGLVVDYERAVGASGVVMGVFGALVYLELRHGAELPAQWRLPRAVIWLGIALQFALEAVAWLVLPIIATGAHVGGFMTGFAVCAVVGAAGLHREPVRPWVVASNGALVVALVASLASMGTVVVRGPDWEHRAERLLAHDEVPPEMLNNVAWLIATSDAPDPEALDAALRLARRAARETDRQDPNILDTLAEVHFQRGEVDDAVAVIEEAVALAPEEAYYRGQRDRFLGRREPDDRPDPPAPDDGGPSWLTPDLPGIEV